MRLNVELGNQEVRDMLVEKLQSLMPDMALDKEKIQIQVKSKQNYRVNEWETGEIRVTYQDTGVSV